MQTPQKDDALSMKAQRPHSLEKKVPPKGILKNIEETPKIDLKRIVPSQQNHEIKSIIQEEEESDMASCSRRKSVNLLRLAQTPKNKSKNLHINTNKFKKSPLAMDSKTNSAMLPSGKFSSFPKIKRMSTIGQNAFNKSMAHNFEFKDLKELEQSKSETSEESDENELHGRSLFVLGHKNKLRLLIKRIVCHSWFDYFILLVILISSITLAIENPLNDPNSPLSRNLNIVNMTMTFIFVAEFMLKVMAFGFLFNGSTSYLRNPWNIIDFFIV